MVIIFDFIYEKNYFVGFHEKTYLVGHAFIF